MLSAFGVGFFYRVILPGILIVSLLAPVRPRGLGIWLGIDHLVDATAAFIVAVFACGLILSGARHVVYYTLEGFYWFPGSDYLKRRLEASIRHALKELSSLDGKRADSGLSEKEKLRELHLNEFLGDFPISTESGEPRYKVDRPTRIGNAMASYEEYASNRYKFDGTFYWFHIRFSADPAVQAELDRTEAMADGLVFCAFGALVVSLVYGGVLIGRVIGAAVSGSAMSALIVPAPAPDGVLIACLLASLTSAMLFNRLAVFALRTFGHQMRATIDLAVPKIIKLGDPWLPSDVHTSRLNTRQAYLSFGAFPRTSQKTDPHENAIVSAPPDAAAGIGQAPANITEDT